MKTSNIFAVLAFLLTPAASLADEIQVPGALQFELQGRTPHALPRQLREAAIPGLSTAVLLSAPTEVAPMALVRFFPFGVYMVRLLDLWYKIPAY
jgi:hypothetical protein